MKFYKIIHPDIRKLRGQVVSFIGGGGKSTLLHRIGRELARKDLKVILTTTTKMQVFPNTGLVLQQEREDYLDELQVLLEELGIVIVAKDYYKADTLSGVNTQSVQMLKRLADVVLIEADGSRQRPLKTHKLYEPPIPIITNTVVVLCAAEVVGKPLSNSTVHRAELFSEKWHLPMGTKLTPEIVANELLSAESYLKNVPIDARVAYFVNKEDKNEIGGRLLAEHLMRRCDFPVYLGSLRKKRYRAISPGSSTSDVRVSQRGSK